MPIELTPTEFTILEVLMRAAGSSRATSSQACSINARPHRTNDRSMCTSHLRRKLEGVGWTAIRTVRGQGYICVTDAQILRSLTARIVIAVLGTLLISLVAFMATFLAMSGPANVRLIRQLQARQIEDGIATLQQGTGRAAAFIARLDQSLGATHHRCRGSRSDYR